MDKRGYCRDRTADCRKMEVEVRIVLENKEGAGNFHRGRKKRTL